MPHDLDPIVAELDMLHAALWQAGADHAHLIDEVDPEHRVGAGNLVHYTVLRAHDLRGLQDRLADLGATSLAAPEANIGAKVLAARNVVDALRGAGGPWDLDGIAGAIAEGDAILDRNAERLFGPSPEDARTRVMVTMPAEAADDPTIVDELVEAGMGLARINLAHDDEPTWRRLAQNIRAAGERHGRRVLISVDLGGPKLRTGPIAEGPAVGRARVTRNDDGTPLYPARLWVAAADLDEADVPVPPVLAGRPPLTVRVDREWLERRAIGSVLRVVDTRGMHRSFEVRQISDGCLLAECDDRNAWIRDGSLVESDYERTRISGIPPRQRRLRVHRGDRIVLTTDPEPAVPASPGDAFRIGCTLPEAVRALRVGDPVVFDDGIISGVVTDVADGDVGEVGIAVTTCRESGRWLAAGKGINMPATPVPTPALTEEDRAALPFVAECADLVALSFVRTVQDVREMSAALDEACAVTGRNVGLVLKIETARGFRELPGLLLEGMRRRDLGVMIARGDLAVELGFERMSEVPNQILALCEAAHVPVVLGTQVLESLAKTGVPSRAEISDAAGAQRAECVMLNKGPWVIEAVQSLRRIIRRVDQNQRKSQILLRHIHSWDDSLE